MEEKVEHGEMRAGVQINWFQLRLGSAEFG